MSDQGPMVRYKRCPQCGTVVLMTMAICPVCDRHFQTTAPYARSATTSWTTQSPYSYAGTGDGFAMHPQALTHRESGQLDWMPIIMAALFLPWLGMILNHQFAKGTVVLLAMIGIVACIFLGLNSPLLLLTGVLGAIAAYVIGLLDVYSIAQRFARGEDVREWDWF